MAPQWAKNPTRANNLDEVISNATATNLSKCMFTNSYKSQLSSCMLFLNTCIFSKTINKINKQSQTWISSVPVPLMCKGFKYVFNKNEYVWESMSIWWINEIWIIQHKLCKSLKNGCFDIVLNRVAYESVHQECPPFLDSLIHARQSSQIQGNVLTAWYRNCHYEGELFL